jgi:hypothetical protein
VQAGALDL